MSLNRLATALADQYRIDRELGAGGMATVYLAHDLRHDRDVAIKVLHPELGAALGGDRFLSEIRTTAKLQHPHILPLLDSGVADGLLYYVMPYLTGETLRARLDRERQLPIEDAVRIACEVADALGAAHALGIVHRDIKPANILLQGGHALLADFGIALAVQSAGGERLTQTGLSLGTPQYMSPEQAMGDRAIDARSDLYSLGAVAYEMLTGQPPFTGATVQAVVAQVMAALPEPPTTMRPSIPAHVETAVLRALEKLPADRFTSAGAMATALVSPIPAAHPRASPGSAAVRRWQRMTAGLAVLAAGLLVALVFSLLEPPQERRVVRVEGESGGAGSLASVVAGAGDGSSYVYCTSDGAVRMRRWEDFAPTPVDGPFEGCIGAAYSPDGRSIAIVGVPTGLTIASVHGDAPRRDIAIAEVGDMAVFGGGIDWASDGSIYIASRNGLFRIAPDDGQRERIARPDSLSAFIGLDVLPGATSALIVSAPSGGASGETTRIGVVDLRTGEHSSILDGVAVRFVKPGHLLVVGGDGSMSLVPFDVASLRPQGAAIPLPDSLGAGQGVVLWQPLVDVTDNGTLLYWRAPNFNTGYPVLVDRSGNVEEIRPRWTGSFLVPRMADDDARFAVEHTADVATQVWVREIRSGASTRLTMGGLLNGRPTWTPDGSGVTIISDADGAPKLYDRRLDADSAIPMPSWDDRPIWATQWSRDGEWLLLRTDDQAPGRGDILAVRPGLDSVATPILNASGVSEYSAELSPDKRWLAYVSNEGGRYEVRVTPFPGGRGQWQISTGGGTEPAWSRDGRDLFYIANDGWLMAAEIAAGPEFRVLSQRRLFDTTPFVMYGIWNRNYDVTRDGRFLMIRRSADATARIVVVFNWAAGIGGTRAR